MVICARRAIPVPPERNRNRVVLCVLDHQAGRQLLDPLGEQLAGRTIVNLASSTPEQARDTSAWATELGVDYLDGASWFRHL